MKKLLFKVSNIHQNRSADVVYLDVDENDNVYCLCCNRMFDKKLKKLHLEELPPDIDLYEWNCNTCHIQYLGPLQQ